ncbi:unnamed protein product [Ectocarpus fasciculatus]
MAGAWVLDLSRSDTMQRYLQVCGMTATNTHAHVLAERKHGGALNLIHLDETTLIIHKRTYLNNYTETFELGEEKVTNITPTRASISTTVSNLGSSSRGYACLIRNASTPEGQQNTEVLERRYVTDGGLCHTQEIQARNLTTGEECGIVSWLGAKSPNRRRRSSSSSSFEIACSWSLLRRRGQTAWTTECWAGLSFSVPLPLPAGRRC